MRPNLVAGAKGGLGRGLLHGSAWWVLGGPVLMPVLLGTPPFASPMMATMLPVAMGSLMGHLMFGALLGLVFAGWRGMACACPLQEVRPAHACSMPADRQGPESR